MTVTLRPATLADLPVLQAWDKEPHVIAAGGDDDDIDWAYELPRKLDWRWNLMAELADPGGTVRPIGIVQIIDPAREESHYWGDCGAGLRAIDVWIGAAADLGRGYGKAMMALAHAFCFADPSVSAILIDPLASNTRAQRFYARLGYQIVGPRRFGDDDCLVMRLSRTDWESRRE